MLKKLFVVMLVIVMALSQINVFAQSISNDALNDLKSLNIIDSEDLKKDLDGQVTRGEFAEHIVKLINMSALADTIEVSGMYNDVPIDASYASSVEILSQVGLMSGTGNGSFSPDAKLTLQQAAKVIISALGYSAIADKSGGWPTGYLGIAARINLFDNVSSSDELSRKDMYNLLYNALDIDMAVELFSSRQFSYKVEEGKTLRYELMSDAGEYTVYKERGIVSATAFSYTDLQIPDLENDEVVINNVVYRVGNTNAAKYLGCDIEFYAVDKNDSFVLISVKLLNNNHLTTIDAKDLVSFEDGVVVYQNANGRRKTATGEEKCRYLYNGTAVRKDKVSEITLTNGTMTIIDNDGNGNAEMIEVWNYESLLIDEVRESLVTFQNGFELNGNAFLHIDFDNEDKKYILIDENGKNITTEELEDDSVLTVYVNRENTRYTLFASNRKISGVITEITEDDFIINGESFGKLQGASYNARLNIASKLYVDCYGKAVYIKETDTDEKYGYVIKAHPGNSLASLPEIKILEAADVSFDSEEEANASDIYAVDEVPVLVCSNSGVFVYNTLDNVKINGNKVKNKDVCSKISSGDVIKYKTDDNGQITAIDVLNLYGGSLNTTSRYDVYEKVFGGFAIQNGIAIDEKTKVISVPKNGAECDDDYAVKTIVRASDNLAGHLVQGYEFDAETKKAKLIVVTKNMRSSEVLNPYLTASKPSMVLSVKQILNKETDDYEGVLTVLEDGETKTFVMESIVNKNNALGLLAPGDMIIYVKNLNEKISNAIKFDSIKTVKDLRNNNSAYDYTVVCGIPESLSMNDVDTINYRLVNKMLVNINGSEMSIEFPARRSIPTYLYDTSSGEIKMADLKEVILGYDRIYLVIDGSDAPLGCVIIRE